MPTYQLIVTGPRTAGNKPPTPELVVAQGGDRFNANLNTVSGTSLASNSATPLLDIGRALRSGGAQLGDVYSVSYAATAVAGANGTTVACCTVRDMMRETAYSAPT